MSRWAKNVGLNRVFEKLQTEQIVRSKIEALPLDPTSVKVHPGGTGAQRKRYGDAVVRHALNMAHEATGIKRSVLHATEAAYPVYLRLCYHPTGKFMGCMLES